MNLILYTRLQVMRQGVLILTLMVSVSPPIPAYAGEDVDICINIAEFELLGSPTIGSNWFMKRSNQMERL